MNTRCEASPGLSAALKAMSRLQWQHYRKTVSALIWTLSIPLSPPGTKVTNPCLSPKFSYVQAVVTSLIFSIPSVKI